MWLSRASENHIPTPSRPIANVVHARSSLEGNRVTAQHVTSHDVIDCRVNKNDGHNPHDSSRMCGPQYTYLKFPAAQLLYL
jgi:hypothetical protein